MKSQELKTSRRRVPELSGIFHGKTVIRTSVVNRREKDLSTIERDPTAIKRSSARKRFRGAAKPVFYASKLHFSFLFPFFLPAPNSSRPGKIGSRLCITVRANLTTKPRFFIVAWFKDRPTDFRKQTSIVKGKTSVAAVSFKKKKKIRSIVLVRSI